MPHVINSLALTGKKPCINKAIHSLLMHGYATLNMIVPGPQICCRYEMFTAQPLNEHSPWKLRSRDFCEKAKQNCTRNNVKCSKCFHFLCNNSNRTWFFNAVFNICQDPWEVLKTAAFGLSFQPRFSIPSIHGTWHMLMHEKPCLTLISQYSSSV